jgi:hypothetical protein
MKEEGSVGYLYRVYTLGVFGTSFWVIEHNLKPLRHSLYLPYYRPL